MLLPSWITHLFTFPRKNKAPRHIPLSLQSLEDRVTPAVPFSPAFPTAISIVTNTGSSGSLASTSAAFTVSFSDAVTGVDASDFSTVVTGNVAVGSLEVSGSGSTYTVTAKGVTGNGTLGLNLKGDASISATASFATQATFSAGDGTISVTLGDVNGDGNIDLVTANNVSSNVSVLLSNGDGSFANRQTFATGNGPVSVTLGDVNRDGKLDLVAANINSANVSVLLGTGNGAFGNQQTFGTGTIPFSVRLGDVNRDGNLDLVTANRGDANVSVLLGTGNGTFATQQTFATDAGPSSVALGDVNGDGKLDLVTANFGNDTVSVLLGNGDGLFASQKSFTADDPYSVTLGDVSGDGKLDMVVANSGNDNVSVLLNIGDGDFAAQQTFATGAGPFSVTLGDANGDGRLDIVTANNGSDNASILLGNGNGTFGAQATFAVGDDPQSVTLGDVNSDGSLDILAANFASDNVSVLLGTISSSPVVQFPGLTNFAAGVIPVSVVQGDVNGDGKVDIVTANNGSDNVSVLLGNGNGTFGPQATFEVGDAPEFAALGDVNGDGKLDIVTANNLSNTASVLLGNGNGTFATQATFFVGNNPVYISLGDANNDGKLDIVTANISESTVSVLLGIGDGTFATQTTFAVGQGPHFVILGDVNGDSKLDIVTANGGGQSVSVLLGDGTGAFANQATFAVGGAPTSLALGDVSGDGKIDLVTANPGGNSTSLLLGDGTGAFATPTTLAVGSTPVSVKLGDVNGDGNLDIVTADYSSDTATVLLGNGNGTFGTQTAFAAGDGPISLSLGNVNRDGRLDIVAANRASNSVSVLLNSIAFTGQTYTVSQPGKVAITAAAVGGTSGAPFTTQPIITIQDSEGGAVISSASVSIAVSGGDNKATLFGTTTLNAVNGIATFTGVGINGTVGQQYTLTFSSTGLNVATQVISVLGSTNVVSINRASGTTASTSADFNVTFNKSVVGVDPSDFVVIKTDTVSSGGISVTGKGSEYTVTVSGITGNGTLGLNLVDNGSIRSLAGDPLYPVNATASFSPQATFFIGTLPRTAALGDVNGDTKTDLVTANRDSNNVSVLLGNGNGTFATQQDIAMGNGPNSVTLGDVNGDGKLDIVTANTGNNTGSVLLGNGNGTFAAQQTFAVGEIPNFVTLGDVNGDTKLDLLTANGGNSNNVSVLLGDGKGAFAAQQTFATGLNPSTVTLGDVNGDNKTDLVTANRGSSTVSVLLGDGKGTFAAQQTFATGAYSGPISVALGKVNGDGNLDIVTANSSTGNASVLLGNGDGTFAAQQTFAAGTFCRTVSLGDGNGDGNLDMVIVNGASNDASVLFGNGDGTFKTQQTFAIGSAPNFGTVGDVDGNGELDLVSINGAGNILHNASVLLNWGKNPIAPVFISFGNSFPRSVTQGDVNGDGKLDLVTANYGSRNVGVLLGNGNGTFASQQTFATSQYPNSVTLGDVNGDGKLDLVTANSGFIGSGNVSVLLGTGTGTFAAQQTIATGDGSKFISLGDVNGDDNLDLVTVNNSFGNNTAIVLLGDGKGAFAAPQAFAVGGYSSSLALGDVNGDSKLDIVTSNFSFPQGIVSVLLGDGTGVFATPQTFALGGSPVSLALGDVNGDGSPDIVTTGTPYGSSSSTASVLLGNGNGTFAAQQTFATGYGSNSVSLGDVNGDGRLDIVTMNGSRFGNSSNTSSVLLGLGDGTFATQTTFAVGSRPVSLSLGDVNGDGRLDIATVNRGDNNVGVQLNALNGNFTGQTFTVINIPPTITSANSASFTVGNAGSFLVTATGTPAPTFSLNLGKDSNFPAGVTLSSTGILSGTPTAGGTFNFTIKAANGVTPDATQNFALTVNPAATTTVLASSPNPSVFGQSVSLQATVTSSGVIPTGTVTFKNGGSTIGSPVSLVGGIATLSSKSLARGVASITAEYSGDSSFSSSTGSTSQLVLPFGPAAILKLISSRGKGFRGKAFSDQPKVTFSDEFGNTVTDSTAAVTVTASTGATVIGTASVNAVNGVATYTNVGLDGAVGTYTLTFTSGNLIQGTKIIDLEAATTPVVTGTTGGSSQGSTVSIVDPATGQSSSVVPFPNFTGEVRVAAGDINGDGKMETIAAAGAGGGPAVSIIDSTGKTTAAFFAFDQAFTGGVFISVSDVNKDGFADIIAGAGEGGGPHVKIFNGKDLTELGSFFAFAEEFRGGVSVASADINGDGTLDVVTGAGPGGGPHVKVFDGKTNSLISQWFAYATDFTGGVFVGVGDIGNDGKFEVVTGAGEGGGPVVAVFDPFTGALQSQFFAYGESFTGGVRVGVSDGNFDGVPDLVTGAGPGGGPHVKGFNFPQLDLLFEFFSGPADDTGGVFVN